MKYQNLQKSNGRSRRLPSDIYKKTQSEAKEVPTIPQDKEYIFSSDPGLEGAWVVIRLKDMKIVEHGEYDDKNEMRKAIFRYRKNAVFTGEDPVTAVRGASGHSNPQSVFRFGRNTGAYEWMVYAFTGRVPHLLSPRLWKKIAGLIGTEKEAVIRTARILSDDQIDLRRTERSKLAWVDLCDALVIAYVYLDLSKYNPMVLADFSNITRKKRYPNE